MYRTKQEYREAWAKAAHEDPPIPLNVDIELASSCNARCTFCLYGDRDWDKSMIQPDWDGDKKRRLMPKDMAFKIINECAEIGIPALKFNFRGESLIHPDYGDIVEYAASLRPHKCSCHTFGQHPGRPDNAFHDLLANTNGNIPNSNWAPGVRGLMACTKIMVSLDSLDPEIYPEVRVGLSLDSACRTIDELVRLKHPDVWVRRVVCKANRDEPFVQKVRERWPRGVKVSEHNVFERNQHYGQEQVVEDPSSWERTFCGYPSQRVVITASGSYSPCCISWEDEFYETGMPGRWPKLSIMDYWNSEWRKNLVGELRLNQFKNRKCQSCTSYLAYKRPERAYVQDVEAT